MQKQTTRKNISTSARRFRLRPIWFLSLLAFLFVLCGVLLTFVHRSQASTGISPQTHSAIGTKVPQQSQNVTPIASQENTHKKMVIQQPTIMPVRTKVAATPTLVTSTLQHTQLGVFPLSAGGPLPVPESILHPTNIVRVILGSTLVSVYAGSMTRNPQAGILCVLRENLMTGEVHLQVYQGPQLGGALTVLSVQQNVFKIANTKMQGSFDLTTNTFQW